MHVLDQGVRSINEHRVSPVAGAGGARARLRFALVTGDLTDNHQRNELRAADGSSTVVWSIRSPENACRAATGVPASAGRCGGD
jgi:hypothetical protein